MAATMPGSDHEQPRVAGPSVAPVAEVGPANRNCVHFPDTVVERTLLIARN
jgi:hypothetical protein